MSFVTNFFNELDTQHIIDECKTERREGKGDILNVYRANISFFAVFFSANTAVVGVEAGKKTLDFTIVKVKVFL